MYQNKKSLSYLFYPLLLLLITHTAFSSPESYRFFITAEGNLLTQNGDGTVYTIIDSNNVDSIPNGVARRVIPNYKLSGEGSIGVFIHEKTDLAFHFLINDHQQADSIGNLGPGEHLDVILIPATWFPAEITGEASSIFSYKTNQYSLYMGHWFSPNPRWQLHPYWGVHVSDIQLQQNTTYDQLDVNTSGIFTGTSEIRVIEKSSLLGVGPLVGMQATYRFYKQLGFTGDIHASLITGPIRSQYQAIPIDINSAAFEEANLVSKTRHSLIELFHMSLGFLYHFDMTKAISCDTLLGYQLTDYMNSSAFHGFPDDLHDSKSTHTVEDIGFSGPFLSIRLNLA